MHQQVAVNGAIFNKKHELLFVRRSAQDDFLPGMWELPGGGTEFGETPQVALQREIHEECGIAIAVGRPASVQEYYMGEGDARIQRVEITFICTLPDSDQIVQLSAEHDAFVWQKVELMADLEMSEYMQDVVIRVVSL